MLFRGLNPVAFDVVPHLAEGLGGRGVQADKHDRRAASACPAQFCFCRPQGTNPLGNEYLSPALRGAAAATTSRAKRFRNGVHPVRRAEVLPVR